MHMSVSVSMHFNGSRGEADPGLAGGVVALQVAVLEAGEGTEEARQHILADALADHHVQPSHVVGGQLRCWPHACMHTLLSYRFLSLFENQRGESAGPQKFEDSNGVLPQCMAAH